MATTQNTFNGNGSNLGPFSFTFKWLESTDIKVSVGGVLKTAGTHYNLQGLNYTTKTGGQVLFTAGNAPPVGTNNIRIYRDTDDEALSAVFSSGSAIRAKDLNDNFTQNLYVTQETNNNSLNVDGSNPMVGPLNMNGFQITNLPVPAVDTNAATKKYVDDRFGNLDIPGHTRWRKVATASQTIFSGTGDYGGVLAYSPTREQVYINGALQQRGVDYAADNGTSVVFTVGLTVGDVVDIICVNNLTNSSISNAGNITYSGQFTGQTARTVAAKLGEVVSVLDFGADPTGQTNSTAAIQAAIAACQTASKTSLFFPTGIYRIQSTINLNGEGIAFVGEAAVPQAGSSRPAVTFRWHGGSSPMFNVQSSYFYFYHIAFENFTTATEAFLLTDTQHMLLDTCSFLVGSGASRFSSAVLRTLGNEFGYSTVRNCVIANPAPRFLYIDGQGTGNGITPVKFENNIVESNALGAFTLVYLKDEGIDILTFNRNTFNGQANAQLTIVDTTDNPIAETIQVLNFFDNEIDLVANTATDRCFRLTNVTNANFWGNQIQGGGSVTAIAELVNSTVTKFEGNGASSIGGPFFSCDATSRVFSGHNRFNNSNTAGIATNPGANKAGGVLQVVTATYNTQTALDITYTDLVAATITPTSETSKILVIVNVNGLAVSSAARTIQANICRGSTQLVEFEKEAGYSGAVTTELAVGGAGATWLDSPQADTALTYKMQVKANATPGAFVCASGSLASITLMELAA